MPPKDAIHKGIERATIVKLSEEELEFLTNMTDPAEGVRLLLHPGLKLVVVTHGKAGCTFVTPDAHGRVPGFKVQPVDTTGAGDAFVAGLLAGLLERRWPPDPRAAHRDVPVRQRRRSPGDDQTGRHSRHCRPAPR